MNNKKRAIALVMVALMVLGPMLGFFIAIFG